MKRASKRKVTSGESPQVGEGKAWAGLQKAHEYQLDNLRKGEDVGDCAATRLFGWSRASCGGLLRTWRGERRLSG